MLTEGLIVPRSSVAVLAVDHPHVRTRRGAIATSHTIEEKTYQAEDVSADIHSELDFGHVRERS
jgi:hypothetical protein